MRATLSALALAVIGLVACSSSSSKQPEDFIARANRLAAEKWAATTPAEHLAEADKRAVKNASPTMLDEAQKHLNAIPTNAPEAERARAVATQIERLRRESAERTKREQADQQQRAYQTLLKSAEQARQEYGRIIDQQLLDQGIESRTSASGPNHTNLVIHDVLAGRVRANAIGSNGTLFSQLKQLGFRKLVYTNDDDMTFTWNLAK